MPVRHILVGDAASHIEHNDRALALNVVPVPETSELLLPRCVPHVELDLPAVREELERVDLDSERRHIALLELARNVALDERGLSHPAVSDQDQLKLGHV